MNNTILVYNINTDKDERINLDDICFIKFKGENLKFSLTNNKLIDGKLSSEIDFPEHFVSVYDYETKAQYAINIETIKSVEKSVFYAVAFINNEKLNAITNADHTKILRRIKELNKKQATTILSTNKEKEIR